MVHVFSSLQVASCDFCDSKMPSGFQWFVGFKLHQWKKRRRSFDIWRSNNKLWQPRWNPRHGFRVICVVSIRSVWVSFCQGFLNNVPFRELLTCHIIKLAGVCLARLVRDSWTVSIRSWEIMIISWMLSSNQLLSWQQLSRHFKQGIHSLRNWALHHHLLQLLQPLCSCLLLVCNVARCARSAGSSGRAWPLAEAGWRPWWETESHPARIHPADECATSNWRGQALGLG